MTYQRDPLSVQYDRQAALVVRLAIDQHEKRARNQRLRPWVRVRVDNPATMPGRDAGGLSRAERAFQRALYYDSRVHQLTARKKPDARWSLRLDWDEAPLLPGMHRNVRVQVFADTDAARKVDRDYRKRDKWSENVELQSGGIGSPKQRFP